MKITALPIYSKVAEEAPKEIADNLPAKVSGSGSVEWETQLKSNEP